MIDGPKTSPMRRLETAGRRFAADQAGAAAVEMALVATPFLVLLFGIIELAMIFLISSSLENATAQASRTIRTGEMQTTGTSTAAAFKAAICNNFGWLQSDCATNLYVDVRTFTTFAAAGAFVASPAAADQPIANKTFDATKLQFTPGGPSDIVVVRAYYQWPLIVPGMTKALETLTNKAVITSIATFRNEPYGT